MTDRRTDLLTNTVTYRDVNVVFNSLNTQICASLPLITLKNAKKLSVTELVLNSLKKPKKAKRHRQTDLPTNMVTYRDANVVYNSLNA